MKIFVESAPEQFTKIICIYLSFLHLCLFVISHKMHINFIYIHDVYYYSY